MFFVVCAIQKKICRENVGETTNSTHVIHHTHKSIILRIGAGGGGRDFVNINRGGIRRGEYEDVAVSHEVTYG